MHAFMILSPDLLETAKLQSLLACHGDVRTATSKEAARSALTAIPSDILFVDLSIITKDGSYLEGIGKLWQGPALAEVVVVADDRRQGIDAIRAGASDSLIRPIQSIDVARVLEGLHRTRMEEAGLDYLRDQFWNEDALETVQTESPAMREVFAKVRQMAGTKTTVLLTGETGTGKSLIARLIHTHSVRREAPFVSVHCGAIPDTLIESELFGHEKGAFTGAVRSKAGRFMQAQGGTIFLDEVGTISPMMQIKLLTVLQERIIQRVGGDRDIPVDVRIIAATNDNLLAMCDEGRFRKDLYYRLNIFPIEIPPLRERRKDILRFSNAFIHHFNRQLGKEIRGMEPSVLEAFQQYDWPGNVRELENLVERACILEEGSLISPQSIPQEFFRQPAPVCPDHIDISLPLSRARQDVVDRFECAYLSELLTTTHGSIKDAARWAGVTPRQLNKLMTRHGLRRIMFRSCEKKN